MACKRLINLRGNGEAQLNEPRVIDGAKNSEVETVTRTATGTEDSPLDDVQFLQNALAHAFEPDGHHDTRSVDKPSSHTRRDGFEVSRAVPTSVLLPLTWNELVARVSAALRHSKAVADNRVARFGDVQVDL
jgi:hypothetical protein